MTAHIPSQSLQSLRSNVSVGYAAVWGLLAAVALGYLGVLAARPDLAARLMLRPPEGQPEHNFSQRSMSKALAELEAAKAAVAKLEDEQNQLRRVVTALEQRGLTTEARVAALESVQKSPAPVTAADRVAVIAKPEADRTIGPFTTGQTALSGQATQGTIEERPAKALREARPSRVAAAAAAGPTSAGTPSAVTTSAVTTSAGTTGALAKPAEPSASGPPVGVLIATGPSLDAVRLSWQLLNETNRSVLRPLEPRYVESTTDGGLFQLIAGPVGTREEAARVCEKLKARNLRCSVTGFTGQPL